MKREPYLLAAVGDGGLAESVKKGDMILCPHCGGAHKLFGGSRVLPGGKEEPTDELLGYRCGETAYIAAVSGRLVKRWGCKPTREGPDEPPTEN